MPTSPPFPHSSRTWMQFVSAGICLLWLALLAEGQIPANDLPVAFDWPKELSKNMSINPSGWAAMGRVDVKGPTERYLDVETMDGKGLTMVNLFIKRDTPLPKCALNFRWRTNRSPKDVQLVAKVMAPAEAPGDRSRWYHTVEKKLTVTPTKEWTVVEIPFDVGEKGLTSFDKMYTFEIRFMDPNVRVMIDQVKLVPLVK